MANVKKNAEKNAEKALKARRKAAVVLATKLAAKYLREGLKGSFNPISPIGANATTISVKTGVSTHDGYEMFCTCLEVAAAKAGYVVEYRNIPGYMNRICVSVVIR
jgi:hypothetical protein